MTTPPLKPTRTAEEEQRLIDLYEVGEMRCYYCDRLINEETDKFSTEFGVFFACHTCFELYGNPDDDILDETWVEGERK